MHASCSSRTLWKIPRTVTSYRTQPWRRVVSFSQLFSRCYASTAHTPSPDLAKLEPGKHRMGKMETRDRTDDPLDGYIDIYQRIFLQPGAFDNLTNLPQLYQQYRANAGNILEHVLPYEPYPTGMRRSDAPRDGSTETEGDGIVLVVHVLQGPNGQVEKMSVCSGFAIGTVKNDEGEKSILQSDTIVTCAHTLEEVCILSFTLSVLNLTMRSSRSIDIYVNRSLLCSRHVHSLFLLKGNQDSLQVYNHRYHDLISWYCQRYRRDVDLSRHYRSALSRSPWAMVFLHISLGRLTSQVSCDQRPVGMLHKLLSPQCQQKLRTRSAGWKERHGGDGHEVNS